MRHASRQPGTPAGFTLIELLVVISIIGILLAFILVASMGAVRAAQERATQALIAKLDTGLGDRLEALLTQRVDPSNLHLQMACVYAPNRASTQTGFSVQNDRDMYQRAGVLARYDQLKAEIPDVFVVQGAAGSRYPLNFCMPVCPPFSNPAGDPIPDFNYVIPLGSGSSQFNPPSVGTGIYGASYTMLAGVNKNLGKYTDPTTGQIGNGFTPAASNGVDDNQNGLIDDALEGGSDASIGIALSNHKHITARSEMLYAMLVEGTGPYGSVFNRDDFTANEVRDTDQDGLPEFVDGWGNPLQFYRWPIFFHSDVQRGTQLIPTGALDSNPNNRNAVYGVEDAAGNVAAPYGRGPLSATNATGPFDTREVNPLDQNQELVMPDWWSSSSNSVPIRVGLSPPISGGVVFFQTYFHQLVDPLAGVSSSALGSTPAASQRYWDRSLPAASSVVLYPRRAFYTRALILSAGPDGQPGVPYLTDPRFNIIAGTPLFTDVALKNAAATNIAGTVAALMIESQALQGTLSRSNDIYQTPVVPGPTVVTPQPDLYTDQLQVDGQDDVTNHNLMSSGVPVQ